MKSKFILFILTLAFHYSLISIVFADTHTSVQSGNWGTGSTWDKGTTPVAGDDAVIDSGHTVNLNANSSITNLTINNGGTLNNNGRTLTVSGNYINNGTHNVNDTLTISGTTGISGTLNITTTTGSKTFTGAVTINSGGVWNNSGNEAVTFRGGLTNNGTFTSGTGTYTFATNSQPLNGTITFSGSVSISGAITVTNYGTITINESLTGSVAGSTWVNEANSTLEIAGTLLTTGTLTATATGNTVNYNSSANRTVKATTYYNLIFSQPRTYTVPAGATVTVIGILTLTDGYIDQTTIPAAGSISCQGDIIQGSGFDGGTGRLVIAGTANQTFTGNATLTSGNLPDLTINKTAGTLTLAGTIRTNAQGAGAWTYTSGTLNPGTSTVIFDGTMTITGSHILYNLTFRTTGTRTIASGTTLTVGGTLTLTDGYLNTGAIIAQGDINLASTFDGSSGTPTTLTISGTNNQTLTGGGSATAGDFLPLTINKTGGTLTLASTIRTGRNWTYTQGTVEPGSSTVVFAIRALTISGSISFYNLTFNRDTTYTISSGTTLTVTGALNLTDGWVNTGAIYAKGDINVASTADNGSAIITLNGIDDQTIICFGAVPGGHLTNTLNINKSQGNAQITGNVRVHNLNLQTGNLTFQGGATYTIHNLDTITTSSGTTLNFSGTSTTNLVTLRSSTTGSQWRLNVNSQGYYSANYVDVKDSNASFGRQIVAYNSVNSGNNLNWLFPSRLVFIPASQNIIQNTSSSAITVQVQDGSGTAVTMTKNIQINLSTTSSTGLFSSSSGFGDTITYVTILAGSSSASFYYKDSTAGSYTITASESPSQGWTDATQTITVESKGIWKYKVPITITSTVNLTDYQILLTINTQSLISSGKMNSDGSDIRFYDSDDVTSLSYWIESGINTTSTKIWVKVPSITTAGKTIYMYYGNSSATSAANGANTFDFFDDFNSFSTTTWTRTNALSTVSGSRLLIYRGSVYTNTTVLSSSKDKVVEAKARWTNAIGSYSGLMIANSQSTSGSNATSKALVYYMTQSANNNRQVWYWAADGTTPSYNLGSALLFTATLNTDYIIAFAVTSANSIKFYRDYSLLRTITGTWDKPFYLWLGYFTGSAAGNTDIKDISVDWVRVRKYASTEPTYTLGSETKNITKLAFITAPQTLVQNQVSNLITVQTQGYDGTPADVSVETNIVLTTDSPGGSFSEDGFSWQASTITLAIPASQNSVSFYYKDTEIGTPTITASESPNVGWTDATQQQTILSAVNTFYVVPSSYQLIAGENFTLTITAIDQDGAVATQFSGTVNLTVNYISPASGSGFLSVTSTSNFINGVAQINQSFSDCGTNTITATTTLEDGSTKTGTSNNIIFIPYDFLVTPDANTQTVNKVFGLKVTARNAQGQTCPNYKGTANLSATYILPSSDQSGTITPSSLGSADFNNGIATITTIKYDKWGRIKIKVAEALDTTRYGESQEIMFNPKDFLVNLSTPPKSRNFYYKDEEFNCTVTVRDQDNNPITNYQGTVELNSSDRTLSSRYTFLFADSGTHNFNLSLSLPGKITLTVRDREYTNVTGQSEEFEIKEAKIKVVSTSGPVGKVAVRVELLDAEDNIISDDDSTTFTVTLTEGTANKSASSDTIETPVTIQGGAATIYISDVEAETVTVTPAASPVLTPVAGTVTFGSFRGRGIGIDMWREIK